MFPLVVSVRSPDDVRDDVVVMLLSLVTDKLLNVAPLEASVMAPAKLFVTVTLPVVFTVNAVVDVEKSPSPISPEPDDNDIDVLPESVPPVRVIVPLVSALTVTTVPPASAPSTISPALPPVVDKPNVPVAVIVPLVVNSALLETATSSPVDAPGPMLSVVPPVPVQVTSPVVLKVKLLVVPVSVVIAPEPDLRFNVVAEIEPPVCPIVPEPLAVKVTVVPLMLLPKLMAPLLPLETSESAPLEVNAVVVVILLSFDTEKLVKVAPCDATSMA